MKFEIGDKIIVQDVIGDKIIVRGVDGDMEDEDVLVKFSGGACGYMSFSDLCSDNMLVNTSFIIFDPDDPRVQELIGKEVIGFDHLRQVKMNLGLVRGVLEQVDRELSHPFFLAGSCFEFIMYRLRI